MTARSCPAMLIAAPASGQGKTTVTAALARLHSRQGRKVRVFKCGPDFLDPMILQAASGAPVYQLDLWMVGLEQSRRLLWEAAAEADLILVEGVMGLFDGTPSAAATPLIASSPRTDTDSVASGAGAAASACTSTSTASPSRAGSLVAATAPSVGALAESTAASQPTPPQLPAAVPAPCEGVRWSPKQLYPRDFIDFEKPRRIHTGHCGNRVASGNQNPSNP